MCPKSGNLGVKCAQKWWFLDWISLAPKVAIFGSLEKIKLEALVRTLRNLGFLAACAAGETRPCRGCKGPSALNKFYMVAPVASDGYLVTKLSSLLPQSFKLSVKMIKNSIGDFANLTRSFIIPISVRITLMIQNNADCGQRLAVHRTRVRRSCRGKTGKWQYCLYFNTYSADSYM